MCDCKEMQSSSVFGYKYIAISIIIGRHINAIIGFCYCYIYKNKPFAIGSIRCRLLSVMLIIVAITSNLWVGK